MLTLEEQKVIDKFEKYVFENNVSNGFLVQLIERAGSFLNIQTIANYAKDQDISYNAAKKYRNVLEIFNVKFVIDNE